MAYLVSRALGKRDLAHLAVVGAVGDMQDSQGALGSINSLIVSEAAEQKLISVEMDLRMFGRQSRSLSQMLAYSSDPIIPGLTGNQSACAQYIESLGISLKKDEGWRSYVDLSDKERETLISAIYMTLLDAGVSEYMLSSMFGEVYTLLNEQRGTELADAKEYATLLNACGRQRQPDVGVFVCRGDREDKWRQAQELLEGHRRQLREGLEFLSQNRIVEKKHLSFFDAGDSVDESIIGVIAGMAYGARIIPYNKPVLAFAQDRDEPSFYKVSARANRQLVRSGIHLGDAMSECSKVFGGEEAATT